MPLSEVAAKDEFLNIKNVSRDDMMTVHRVPYQMMDIMPNNVGGFGDVEKASSVFAQQIDATAETAKKVELIILHWVLCKYIPSTANRVKRRDLYNHQHHPPSN